MSPRKFPLRPFLITTLITLVLLVGAIEIGLRLVPGLIPRAMCARDGIVGKFYCQPHFVYDKPIRLAYWYTPGLEIRGPWDPAAREHHSDPASIAPTERSDVFEYELVIDSHGFPNGTAEWQEQYDAVIVGDSFTLPSAPRHWIDTIKAETGLDILTLGATSWSTPNEVAAAEDFGLDKRPNHLILLYFEGNDLFNIAQYQERQPTGLSWKEFELQEVAFYRRSLTYQLLRTLLSGGRSGAETPGHYRYPIQAQTDIGPVDLVLEDLLLLPLSADYETLVASDEFGMVREELLRLQSLTTAQETDLLVVYIPTKAHVYWPRVWEPEDTSVVLDLTKTVTLSGGDNGRLQWESGLLDYETFSRNQGAQAALMDDFTAENGIEFLDLTPIFQQAAIENGELYNYVDSHLNQAGNDLLAEIIVTYLVAAE